MNANDKQPTPATEPQQLERPTAERRPWQVPTFERMNLRDAMFTKAGAGDGAASS